MSEEAEELLGVKCPEGHEVFETTAFNNNRQCDRCGEVILKGDAQLTCEECGYDVCKRCSLERKETWCEKPRERKRHLMKLLFTLPSMFVIVIGITAVAAAHGAISSTTDELVFLLRQRQLASLKTHLSDVIVKAPHAVFTVVGKITQNLIDPELKDPAQVANQLTQYSSYLDKFSTIVFIANLDKDSMVAANELSHVWYKPPNLTTITYNDSSGYTKATHFDLTTQPWTLMTAQWPATASQLNWTTLYRFPFSEVGHACVTTHGRLIVGAFVMSGTFDFNINAHISSKGSVKLLLDAGFSDYSGGGVYPVSREYERQQICGGCVTESESCRIEEGICVYKDAGFVVAGSREMSLVRDNGSRLYLHESDDEWVAGLGRLLQGRFPGGYAQLVRTIRQSPAGTVSLRYDSSIDSYSVDIDILESRGKALVMIVATAHDEVYSVADSNQSSMVFLAIWVVTGSYFMSFLINLSVLRPVAEAKIRLSRRIYEVREAYTALNADLTKWSKDHRPDVY
eukprot:TRINITY_DN3176_c0_g2_i1.p1 TRINITY_DN3176_c0_g2~~TRINITY_DN3176_c0_g2_i1.p1  ORF type:complete len:513 (+),score=127.69 TRINITY_DN3176_c0_g2_i1:29-1567(+)